MALKTSNKNRKKEPVIETSTAEMWEIGMMKEWEPIDQLAPHERAAPASTRHYESSVDKYMKENDLAPDTKINKGWYVLAAACIAAALFLI